MNTFWSVVAISVIIIVAAGVVLAVKSAMAIVDFLEGKWLDDTDEGGRTMRALIIVVLFVGGLVFTAQAVTAFVTAANEWNDRVIESVQGGNK